MNTQNFTRLLVCILLYLLPSLSVSAQCLIDQNIATSDASVNFGTHTGQNFIACADGVINELTVYPVFIFQAGPAEILFSSGNDTNTGVLLSQSITINSSDQGNPITIVLDTPIEVVNGESYAFSFRGVGATEFGLQTADDLVSGNLIQIANFDVNPNFNQVAVQDLKFSVSISNAIPTIDQWGLLIMSLILSSLGLGYIVLRKEQFSKA